MKIKKLFTAILLFLSIQAFGAKVDTILVKSSSMNKDIKVVMIVPDVALGNNAKTCPVIYLLHGHGGNERSWIGVKPQLPQIADEKGIIFVCPDGKNSWYWDSPKNPAYRYETFVAKELTSYVDKNYQTINNRKARAITGLSMGGHGALFLAIRHKETFGAAGSTSGGVDIRPFPNNWGMKLQLGDYASNKETWNKHTVITQLDKIKNGDLAIIFDCGMKDFFLSVNENLHKRLVEKGINHDFILRPGGHDGNYWNNALDYQLLFFQKFFDK